jgi:hypothetical protein
MNTMEFSEISKESLAKIFESAAIESKISDENNEIYLNRNGVKFPVWVQLDSDAKHIRLYTTIKCKEDAPIEDLSAFAQKLNDIYHTVQFTTSLYDDDDNKRAYLDGCYTIYLNFGIIIPQLIKTTQRFAEIFIDAVRENDSENVFFK